LCNELLKSLSTVANGMFPIGVYFGKTLVISVRLKHRIIAKPFIAARRPDKLALNITFGSHANPIRPT